MAVAQSKPNWFVIGISVAVAVVLVGLGAVVWSLNQSATAPGVAPKAAIVDSKNGAISFGEGKTEVDTFVDFMCPACGSFEQQFGEQLQSAAEAGDITLKVHPISILNHLSQGTEYSSRAASAMYCVAEKAPDSALAYFNLLFENQPTEGTAGMTDDQLVALAGQAGADGAAECINDGTYKKFSEDQVTANEISATPTIDIDGKRIENAALAQAMQELFAKSGSSESDN